MQKYKLSALSAAPYTVLVKEVAAITASINDLCLVDKVCDFVVPRPVQENSINRICYPAIGKWLVQTYIHSYLYKLTVRATERFDK